MIIEYSFDDRFKKLWKSLDRMNYSHELRNLDGVGEQLDLSEFSRKFFSKKQATADVSVDSNANIDKTTVLHYNNEIAKPLGRMNSYYLLWKYGSLLFNEDITKDIIKKQFTKEIYINDFSNYQAAYCFNFSCMDIVCHGIDFAGQTVSKPAKHLSSFVGHMIAFLTYASNQIAGAVGLADFLICVSWYVEKLLKDHPKVPKNYLISQIKQELQGFIYQANQPFRGSLQAPFSNFSIYDDVFLTQLCSEYIFPDNSKVKKETVKEIQNLYLDIMNETLEKTPITFPVTTACFATGENEDILDKDFLNLIAEKNLSKGFINIYAGKTSSLSSCCRLRSDRKQEFFNSFGSGSTKIGSIGVVTLNLPRLAYESKTKEQFLERVKENAEAASRINHIKRYLLNKRIKNGYLPLYSLGYMNLNQQYSTCGINGVYESVIEMGNDVLDSEGQQLIKEILTTINDVNEKQEKKYKTPHNCEQTPSESSAVKLAQADKILGLQTKYHLYSNQFIPLTSEADIYDRIQIQGKFDQYMTGGAICHLHFIDQINDRGFMCKVIEESVKAGVVYHAINYNLQRCETGHITVGKNKNCPICNSLIVSNYIRVVGFLTDVSNWNKTRREQDYPIRQFYNK